VKVFIRRLRRFAQIFGGMSRIAAARHCRAMPPVFRRLGQICADCMSYAQARRFQESPSPPPMSSNVLRRKSEGFYPQITQIYADFWRHVSHRRCAALPSHAAGFFAD
jgi:hypothetical protein